LLIENVLNSISLHEVLPGELIKADDFRGDYEFFKRTISERGKVEQLAFHILGFSTGY
jgi:hypothetical protein